MTYTEYKIKLSPYAKIFYEEWLLDSNSSRYNLSIDQTLHGNLDIKKLRISLKRYIAEYVLLNSHIQDINGEVCWVKNDAIIELEYSENSVSASELIAYVSCSFDLRNGPLYRFKLLQINKDVHRLIFVFHHIIVDGGISLDSGIFEEISNYYNNESYITKYSIDDQVKLISNLTDTLLINLAQYKDKHKEFWRNNLSDVENIDLDFLRLKRLSYIKNTEEYVDQIEIINFDYDDFELGKLNKIKLEYGITPYAYGQCIFALLLHRYTGQERIVINYPVAIKEGSDFIYGSQINTNLVVYSFDQSTTIIDLFNQNKEFFKSTMLNIARYGYYPISNIIQDGANKKLLNICFAQTFFRENPFKFKEITRVDVSDKLGVDGVARSLLLFEHDARNNKLNYRVRYNKNTFDKGLLNNFVTAYRKIFSEILKDLVNRGDNKQISSYNLLDFKQYQQVIYGYNQTGKNYSYNKTVYQLFEEQVVKTPNNIAVMFEETRLTYQELNQKANQLARYIRKQYQQLTKKELKPDTLIALYLNRSHDMIISVLAVLKAGGAYVPIDPNYPENRIRYLLNDTKADIVITQKYLQQQLEAIIKQNQETLECKRMLKNRQVCFFVVIDNEQTQINLSRLAVANLDQVSSATDLVYIIYTSGTTGFPKGVACSHSNVINLIECFYRKFLINLNDSGSLWTSLSFDVSVYEIWTILFSGACLHVLNENIRNDTESLFAYLCDKQIKSAYIPSFMLPDLLRLAKRKKIFLTKLLVGVEPIEEYILINLRKYILNLEIINGYGPTETTVCATLYYVDRIGTQHNTPIGRPVDNMMVYILDRHLQPVPIGASGELYIGGAGLARYYLNQSELTQERFITNIFATEKDISNGYTRLYKTGDLARWLPDGNIEYMGRNDFQVKIRGFRVELGEIENTISKLPGIKQVAVQAKDRQTDLGITKCLVAYYVISSKEVMPEFIIAHLSKTLPDYMIPSAFVELRALPLTMNGKLDRKALPNPEFTSIESYVAPRNELEQQLCKIWQEALGIERVGITDDFFRIGGNSISAIRIAYKIGEVLKKHVPVFQIFQFKTIASLLGQTLDINSIHILVTNQDQPRLSFAQERLLFIEQYEEGTNAYNIPIILQLKASVDITAIEQSIQTVCQRHHILRTTFKQNENTGKYYQLVLEIKLEIDRQIYVTQRDLNKQLIKNSSHIFRLEQELPIKIWLYQHESGDRSKYPIFLLINIHHIASDGWSTNVLFKELNSYYNYYTKKTDLVLPELNIQYKDFAVWQRGYLIGEILNIQLNYWKEQLLGFELLRLPTDKVRPNLIDYTGQDVCFSISLEQTTMLKKLAKEQKVTLYSVLLSIFYITLFKYTNQKDITIGVPIANRHYAQLENLIGLFVNSLAVRARFDSNQKIEDFIQQIHIGMVQAQTHQDLPFEKLVEELNVEKDTSRHPIFQVMFGVQSFGCAEETDQVLEQPFSSCVIQKQCTVAKFDLSLFIDDSQEQLSCSLNYATSLFYEDTIKRFARHYKHIIQQITKNYRDRRRYTIHALQVLTPIEYRKIAYDYNQTDKNYPHNKTIHQLFEEQVLKTPNNIAVIDRLGSYTYLNISKMVNNLLTHLCSISDADSGLVAILSEKGYQQVVAALAIMKSCNAYLPLSIDWPVDRIQQILKEGQVKTLVVSSAQYEYIKETSLKLEYKIIIVEKACKNEILLSKKTQYTDISSNSIAYVIFTSGSTGKPKGVTISHKGAVNTIHAINEKFNVNENDKILALSELSFDLSVYDIFGLLVSGGAVIFPEQNKAKDPSHWLYLVNTHNITIWNTVPQLLRLFTEHAIITNQNFSSLRIALISGDWIPVNLPYQVKNLNPKIITMSLGGATEGSIWSVWYEINEINPTWVSIPYGKAMPNQKIYILGEALCLLPIGSIGEIYIGGDGVAIGYWNDPDKTEASFISHPNLGRLYKTGDLARWLPDGNIEYMGRNDFQVKIRGFRVELGEIENTISKLPGIKQVAVQAKDRQTDLGITKCLVAYYVISSKEVMPEFIIAHLSKTLPDYMIPSAFVELRALPLTMNGKLDRKALPNPEFTSIESYVAPRNELEQQLCKIWQEALGIERVGITDDFFRMGGDSILSIVLSSKMRQAGFSYSVKDIFERRMISSFSELPEKQIDTNIKIEQGRLEGTFDLLPIQKWFFNKLKNKELGNHVHWNQSFIAKVPELDIERLQAIIPVLVEHHDILRAKYTVDVKGKYTQSYYAQINIPKLNTLDVSNVTEDERYKLYTKWQSNFNLEKGPLWQIGYMYGYQDKTARIYFALHHLIVDAVSWRILTEDIRALYNKEKLQEKTTSYRQWVKIVNEYPIKNKHEQKYWNGVQCNQQDYTKHIQPEAIENYSKIEFNRSITKELLICANNAYNTNINDLMLTALGYALKNWNDNRANHITLEGHGRQYMQEDIDLSKTVGWFTTVYPIKLEVQKTLKQSIKYIKESLRRIPNKGLGYGAFKYFKNQKEYNLENNKPDNKGLNLAPKELPPISFNYLGQFDSYEGLWQITGESSGKSIHRSNKDTSIINMNGLIIDGKLSFNIASKLTKEKTRKLSNDFKQQLRKIIKHCIGKVKANEVENTLSDFTDYVPYVTFHSNNKPPLFIFPPGNGGAESYFNSLVPLLPEKYLVLFNNFYLYLQQKHGNSTASQYTYEQLASEHIFFIKTIQPIGPYNLFGWSFGGILAFEIARQLCLSGEKLHKLIIVDSFFDQKTVIKTLSKKYMSAMFEENINHMYCPKNVVFNNDASVIMFKATKSVLQKKDLDMERNPQAFEAIVKYYAHETEDNCILKVLKYNSVNIIPINSSHIDCFSNADVLKKIAYKCLVK